MTDLTPSDPTLLTEEAVLAGRDQVIAQMRWMRQYGMQLIESVPHELWYKLAPACRRTWRGKSDILRLLNTA